MTRITIWTDQLTDQLINFTNHLNLNEYSYNIINKLEDNFHDGPLIIYFDPKKINIILSSVSNLKNKVVMLVADELDEVLMSKMSELDKFVFGVINISSLKEESYKIIESYLEISFSQMDATIFNELEKIKESTLNELGSIKTLHERIVRPRIDKFKFAKFTSKFSSGIASGGEFFDCFNDDESIYVYFKTTSYRDSSELINEVERCKYSDQNNKFDTLVNCLEKYKNNISYVVLKVDSKEKKIDSSGRGDFRFFLNDLEINFAGTHNFKIESFDKLIFISEGFLENWNKYYPDLSFSEKLIEIKAENNATKISEFFYELYKKRKEKFHLNDSLISIIDFDFENNIESLKKG